MVDCLSKLREIPRGNHVVLLSSRSYFDYEPVAHFIAAGLSAGERCVVLTEDDAFLERFSQVFEELQACALPHLESLDRYLKTQQFLSMPTDSVCAEDGLFHSDLLLDRLREMRELALAKGFQGLRLFCDHGWLRRCFNRREALEMESGATVWFAEYVVTTLCLYYAEDLKPGELEHLVRGHHLSFFQTRHGLIISPPDVLEAGNSFLPVLHGSLIGTFRLVEANRRIAFLSQLSQAISYKSEPSEITHTSVELLVHYLRARAGFLAVLDFDASAVQEVAAVGLEKATVEGIRTLSPLELTQTCFYRVAEIGGPKLRERGACPLCGWLFGCDHGGRCLAIPIRHQRDKIGVAVIIGEDIADYNEEGLEWLRSVGETIGMAYAFNRQQIRWLQEQSRVEKMRSLGILTSGIAHDFNNLLAIIVGNLQLAREKAGDPLLRGKIEQAFTAARDASALVRRVQEFYRPNAPREFRPVRISELVQEAVAFTHSHWHSSAIARGASIDVVLDARSTALVSGSETSLREALVNILINAFEALDEPGGTITVRTRDSGAQVIISVTDDGCGIPSQTLPHLFDPFFTTKGDQGSGLGLSIAHNIITDHRGKIDVQSRADRGSTFDIILPVALPVDNESGVSGDPGNSVSAVGISVLLIDDELAVLTTLKNLLISLGCRVKAVRSGEEALNLMHQDRFDMVFCDLAMPGLTGLEIGSQLKSAYPEVPFVLVTGWIDPALDGAMRNRVDLVLRKPVVLDDLRNALGSGVAKRFRYTYNVIQATNRPKAVPANTSSG